MSTKRVSVSLPSSVVDDLDYISGRLGLSRSGFLTQMLLRRDLRSLRTMLSHVPEDGSPVDLKRFRGDSRAFFDEQMKKLQELQGGLFDGITED